MGSLNTEPLRLLSQEELTERREAILAIYNKHRAKHKILGPLEFIGQDGKRGRFAKEIENDTLKQASNQAVRTLNSAASRAKRNSYEDQEIIGHFTVYVIINKKERILGQYTVKGLEQAIAGLELLKVDHRVVCMD